MITDPPLVGSYDDVLVALSVVIAIMAAYAALDLARRVTFARGWSRLLWLTGGAIAMGFGIWSMHYMGMLAFRLPVSVQYDWPTVVLSLIAAIVASAVALVVVSRPKMDLKRALLGSVLMGGGIATMHYTGMQAMRMPAMCSYSPGLVGLSVVLAIVISLVALWLTFHFRRDAAAWSWRKSTSAVVMGLAIPVMHYTGMAAVTFTPSEMMHDDLSHAISVSSLGVTAIGLATFVVLGAVLLSNLRFDSLPTARQLIARYFLSLGLISVLAILGMLLVEHQGGETRVEARTINIAGRQRTLSQAIAKDAVLIARSTDVAERLRLTEDLRGLDVLWEKLHAALQRGDVTLGVSGSNSPAIREMFAALQPDFTIMAEAARTLAEKGAAQSPSMDPTAEVNVILSHERTFLRGMDDIVFQYDREASFPDRTGSRLQMALLLSVLGVLLAQGILVLRPALANIHQGISQLELAKQALQCKSEELARSNAELEQFAYVASHDLQEPLRMVASYTQLLARRYQGKLDRDADEFIGFAVDGATRMQTLIRDLLSYSRVMTQGRSLQPVDTRRAFDAACENLHKAIEESSVTVSVGALPVIQGDATQMTQLFQNLLGNALKYRNEHTPRIHVEAKAAERSWLFSVEDNGIGIEPQYFERIFQMFQRLHTREKYSGTGIGLAICRRIVERHGGRIWVESAPGRGSTFLFAIPRA
ncbi:MAG: domain S-box protein [Gammaproteobacteria bacterium]|nr:domain S-box protein [Gammaproteobacteria bacterium]